ncbi:MAG: orotidine-5'-phosphate decarboxylase [Candidatus Acetothermia bacterium]
MSKYFKEKITKRSEALDSRLIFALDISYPLYSLSRTERLEKRDEIYQEARNLLDHVQNHIAAVKINYPLLLTLGPDMTSQLLDETDVPSIADFKVADIANTCKWIGTQAMEMGFSAIIAHPFVGYEKGLDVLFDVTEEYDGGVILVINMSHPGSKQFITPVAEELADFAREKGADGVVAPATRPEEVEEARSWVGQDLLLLTPGVGAQGGEPGDAIRAGADFEIVGRGIYQAERPGEAAGSLRDQMREAGQGDG